MNYRIFYGILVAAISLLLLLSLVMYLWLPEVTKTEWYQIYKKPGNDYCFSVLPIKAGGFAMAGYTLSEAGDSDVYLIRTDVAGHQLWNLTYGGPRNEYGRSVQECPNGNILVAGYCDPSGNGDYDVSLLKVNSTGSVIWNRTYGGSGIDYGYAILPSGDGNYVVTGYSSSNSSVWNIYLLKIDPDGNQIWAKIYYGKNCDIGIAITDSGDGFVIAGKTLSEQTGWDIYILKVGYDGTKRWERTFPESQNESAFSVIRTSDGGFLLAGVAESQDQKTCKGMLLKTDDAGNLVWSRQYGEHNYNTLNSVVQVGDGGYLSTGYTESYGGVISDNGNIDLLKVNVTGHKVWERSFGGTSADTGFSIAAAGNGSYAVTGFCTPMGQESSDVFLMKVTGG